MFAALKVKETPVSRFNFVRTLLFNKRKQLQVFPTDKGILSLFDQ